MYSAFKVRMECSPLSLPDLPMVANLPPTQAGHRGRRVRVLVLKSDDTQESQAATAKKARILEKINFVPVACKDSDNSEMEQIVNGGSRNSF